MINSLFSKIVEYFKRKIMSRPYVAMMSNIGFKAIGKSSDFRTLPVTEGRIYIPSMYSVDTETGGYTNFIITVDGGQVIRIAKSDIGTIFKVIPYVRERLMTDETLL